jgi:hypothetical protein
MRKIVVTEFVSLAATVPAAAELSAAASPA